MLILHVTLHFLLQRDIFHAVLHGAEAVEDTLDVRIDGLQRVSSSHSKLGEGVLDAGPDGSQLRVLQLLRAEAECLDGTLQTPCSRTRSSRCAPNGRHRRRREQSRRRQRMGRCCRHSRGSPRRTRCRGRGAMLDQQGRRLRLGSQLGLELHHRGSSVRHGVGELLEANVTWIRRNVCRLRRR